jgi:hypothetical protein
MIAREIELCECQFVTIVIDIVHDRAISVRRKDLIGSTEYSSEVLPNVQRVSALPAVGTAAAATPPYIPPTRLEIIQAAFDTGLVLRSPRIGWGALYPVPSERWAPDTLHSQSERQSRESAFVRHFNNYPLELIKDYGEQLSKAHGLAASPQNARYLTAASLNMRRGQFAAAESRIVSPLPCKSRDLEPLRLASVRVPIAPSINREIP